MGEQTEPHPDGLERLRAAILDRAMEDYEQAFNGNKLTGHPEKPNYWIKELELFFQSDWCDTLTGGIDPETIIKTARLRAMYRRWRDDRECAKCDNRDCMHLSGTHYVAVEREELECLGFIKKKRRKKKKKEGDIKENDGNS